MNPLRQPKRIQRKRTKGWKMPPGTVSVTRPGKYGNPYPVEVYGRQQAIDLFRADLLASKSKLANVMLLRGKNLACFCPLDLPCHADVLLNIANNAPQPNDTNLFVLIKP